MIYDCIEILPDNVKSSLSDADQERWRAAFNKTVQKSKNTSSYREAVKKAWESIKGREGCRWFSGFVSTEDLDRQNDVVLVDMALDKIRKHIERGGTMIDTHTNRTVGSFYFAEKQRAPTGRDGIYAYGVIYKGEPYHDNVWELIKKAKTCPTCQETRKGFSIGGFALDTRTSCNADGCHRDIVDMSIHEISICQEPANQAALIDSVNMLAKTNEEMDEMSNEINKDLRGDSPAEDVVSNAVLGAPSPGLNAEAPENVEEDIVEQIKVLVDKAKDYEKGIKELGKLKEAIDSLMVGLGAANGQQVQGEVAKGIFGTCGCMDTDVHTPINGTCKMPKELYGDEINQKDDSEFVDKKDLKPADVKFKETKAEMVGGPKQEKTKTAKEGPAIEEKKMKGFKMSETKKAEEQAEIVIPEEHLEEDIEEATDIKDASNEIEEKADEIIEEDVDTIGKAGCACEKKIMSEAKNPDGASKNVKDNGGKRVKKYEGGDKGGEAMEKSDETGEKVEIPKELLGAFQEFLSEKGIKLEPEVNTPEIEAPMEKTMFVDEYVTETDLQELTDARIFDSCVALGKAKVHEAQINSLNARIELENKLSKLNKTFLILE